MNLSERLRWWTGVGEKGRRKMPTVFSGSLQKFVSSLPGAKVKGEGLSVGADISCLSVLDLYLHLAFLFLTSSVTSGNNLHSYNPESATLLHHNVALYPRQKSRLKHLFFFNPMKFSHQQSVCPAKTKGKQKSIKEMKWQCLKPIMLNLASVCDIKNIVGN